MSLFCRGIVPEKTVQEMMELRCYLDLVVRPHLDTLLGYWSEMTGHPCNQDDARKLRYNASQLATRLRLAAASAERIEKAIIERNERGI